MEKLIYIVWDDPGIDRGALRARLLDEIAPRLLALGPVRLSINIDDEDADIPSPIWGPEDEEPFVAQVSIWLETLDDRHPYEDVLAGAGSRYAGWLVTESLCADYGSNEHSPGRDWPDGKRSPGVLTVACLERPDRIPYDVWVEHWHTKMSPVSAELQPRARYVRNAVVRSVTPDAPEYAAIVEEAWPSKEHVTDPMLFYNADGSQERLEENMMRMIEVVTAFLDLDRVRNVTMSEYLLKS